jgi:hypothetical protein
MEVSVADFDVKLVNDDSGVNRFYCVFKAPGDRVGVTVDTHDMKQFREDLKAVAAWAWNSALKEAGQGD